MRGPRGVGARSQRYPSGANGTRFGGPIGRAGSINRGMENDPAAGVGLSRRCWRAWPRSSPPACCRSSRATSRRSPASPRATSRTPAGAAYSPRACCSSRASRPSSSCSASRRRARQHAQDNRELLNKISAALIIAMGVFFIAALFVTRLNREWRRRRADGARRDRRADRRRRGFRDRLDALRRPHARRDPHRRRASRAPPAAAHCCWPSTRRASRSRSCSPPSLFTRMTTAFAVVKRHYAVIMAVGGAILIVDGRADLDRRDRAASTPRSSTSSQTSASISSATSSPPSARGWRA